MDRDQVKVAFCLSRQVQLDRKMNGFADHGLDESAFGESKAFSAVKAFDAFRECLLSIGYTTTPC